MKDFELILRYDGRVNQFRVCVGDEISHSYSNIVNAEDVCDIVKSYITGEADED